ncbi:hypothetical protein C8Q80DRAFT_103604 [Daedaleopsis nitida]|nr:hypothetical protein C8Q80DRAFT_103604 [Daedaleopsis nitida]
MVVCVSISPRDSISAIHVKRHFSIPMSESTGRYQSSTKSTGVASQSRSKLLRSVRDRALLIICLSYLAATLVSRTTVHTHWATALRKQSQPAQYIIKDP